MGLYHWIFKKKVRKISGDFFINRLRSSVLGEGMLTDGNIFLINHAIENMPESGAVVEIGIYGGVSSNLICYLMGKHQKSNSFFNCDPWIYEGYHDAQGKITPYIDGRSDIRRDVFMDYIKSSYVKSVTLLNKKPPHTFHLKSEDFFELWNAKTKATDIFDQKVTLGGPIAFAYIDGDHSYEMAKSDFTNVSKYLVSGGFILFDDSADGSGYGSAKLMKEVLADKKFKLVLKNPNYLFQRL